MKSFVRAVLAVAVCITSRGGSWCCAADSEAAERVARLIGLIGSAKPGETVTLPAGTFEVGDVIVPPRVSIRGAGDSRTILDASRFQSGLQVLDSKDVQVSDLTVRNAGGVGLRVANSSGVVVRRVRSLGNGVGVLFDHAAESRLENAVVAQNRTGLVMLRAERSVFVNCTAAHNGELAVSLTGTRGCAAFNNLFTGSQRATSGRPPRCRGRPLS
jgi:nitrous oxidase accessory protein NosD